MSKLSIIIGREYSERVKKKSFILTTLLMPLGMILLGLLPTVIMMWGDSGVNHFYLVDPTGRVVTSMQPIDDIVISPLESYSPERGDTFPAGATGVIVLPPDVVATGSGVKVYTSESLSINTEGALRGALSRAVEQVRIDDSNVESLRDIMNSIECNISLQAIRTSPDGRADDGQSASSLVSFILGYVLTFILYIALMLYGQMVMMGIIEEKSNRVLELVVSTVKPFQLMLGKILGIGAVAATQILIWLILMVAASGLLLPLIVPADLLVAGSTPGALDTVAAAGIDADLLGALAMFADPWFVFRLFFYLLIFVVCGFLLYASIYAAVGSAVDNVQDASQLTSFAIIPIIVALLFGMQAASAPSSTLAVVMSFVPFTSPMVMMARIPSGVADWQIWLSLLVLIASTVGAIWLAAKIYRVGIFMYGKKPTIKELWQWMRL